MIVASLPFPEISEAAAPATGDGLSVLSPSTKDNFDGGYLHLIVR